MISCLIEWLTTPWVCYTIIVQGLIAVGLIHYALKQREDFNKLPPEVHAKYPAFERDDMKNWNPVVFYVFGFFFLFPKLLFGKQFELRIGK